MPHRQSATTRRLWFGSLLSSISAQSTCPAPQPEEDHLERGTVVEEPYLDVMGRAMFTAVSHRGIKIADGVAATLAERERVLARLWEAVDQSAERPPLALLREG